MGRRSGEDEPRGLGWEYGFLRGLWGLIKAIFDFVTRLPSGL